MSRKIAIKKKETLITVSYEKNIFKKRVTTFLIVVRFILLKGNKKYI